MIFHYTKHAEKKFYMLQKHGRQILKEDITDIVKFPDKFSEKRKLCFVSKAIAPDGESWEVVYRKDESVICILTFYPIAAL